MAEDRIVKLTNITKHDIPAHKARSIPTCTKYGCAGCEVPTWNRIEFPMKSGETIVVKENVGNHLQRNFPGRLKITAGPFDTTQLLSAPDGFFEHDPITGKMRPIAVRTNTTHKGSSQDLGADGERLENVKRKGRFLAKGGDTGEDDGTTGGEAPDA